MIEVFDCEQGSDAWFRARLGIPTASEFHTVLAKGKDGGASVTRKTYMLKLAGEIITGEPMENYSNAYMARGNEMEDEARSFYTFMTGTDVKRVGFVRNGNTGCSPDGLIDANGMHEIKTKAPHLFIECALRDSFPPEHKAQCQGGLWVAEREWIDLTVYWPKMPGLTIRSYRDEPYIRDLAAAVEKFNSELADTVERVRKMERAA